MRSLIIFCLSTLVFSQSTEFSLAFQAQAINSIYMGHQAISASVNQFSLKPENRDEVLKDLQNYSLIIQNLTDQLFNLKNTGSAIIDSVFLNSAIETNENLSEMAAAYADFIRKLDPKFANRYNELHQRSWQKITKFLYLKENND